MRLVLLLAVLLLSSFGAILLSPAPSAADSGSVTVNDAGGGMMRASVNVTSTSCSQYGFCGWFAFGLERHSSLSCTDDSLFIVGLVGLQENSGTSSAEWTFRPFFPRSAKLCVFVHNTLGTHPVAETIYTVPASYGHLRSSGYNCSHFGTQSAAQYYLQLYPGDPSNLDGEGDGIACESNKCPCGGEKIPPEPEEVRTPTEVFVPANSGAAGRCKAARRQEHRAARAVELALARSIEVQGPGKQRWRRALRKRKGELREAKIKTRTACGE
jgi:hypothetical protein